MQTLMLDLQAPSVVPGDYLAPELEDTSEYIGVGDKVYIDPLYGIAPFYAYVEAVFEELGCVEVWHAQGGYPAGWHMGGRAHPESRGAQPRRKREIERPLTR